MPGLWRRRVIGSKSMISQVFLEKGTLRVYEGLSHGMCTTHADIINGDLLAFVQD